MEDVVRRYQWHKDTPTCFKKGSECRFGFPRELVAETTLVSEECSKGHGVLLRRRKGEERVNNYHPKLLNLLRCNMDIQVVTGVAAVALYIAKYIGKNEPETLRDDIRHTLQTLRDSRQHIRAQMQKVINNYHPIALKIINVQVHRHLKNDFDLLFLGGSSFIESPNSWVTRSCLSNGASTYATQFTWVCLHPHIPSWGSYTAVKEKCLLGTRRSSVC